MALILAAMNAPSILLRVVELLGHANLNPLFERLGYKVQTEFAVRRAVSALRKEKPAVVVADLYYQPDFRDRVSNLESLLAALQAHKDVKIVVLYETAHQHALDRLLQRFRVDASFTLPVDETRLTALLAGWRG
jgi:ActR/RegA family two-component response regulator